MKTLVGSALCVALLAAGACNKTAEQKPAGRRRPRRQTPPPPPPKPAGLRRPPTWRPRPPTPRRPRAGSPKGAHAGKGKQQPGRRLRQGPLHGLDHRRPDVRQLGQARPAGAFPVGGVIKGWTEGLQLMRRREARFWIPAALAYGDRPAAGARPACWCSTSSCSTSPAPSRQDARGRRSRAQERQEDRLRASPTACSRRAPARNTPRPRAPSTCTTRAGPPTARCSTARSRAGSPRASRSAASSKAGPKASS